MTRAFATVGAAFLFAATLVAPGTANPVPRTDDRTALPAGADPNRYIVSFSDPTRGRAAVAAAGGVVQLDLPSVGAVAATIPPAAVAGLARNPHITLVEPDAIRELMSQVTPWGIPAVMNPPTGSSVPQTNAGGAGVVVCIIDSGIDSDHEDLSGITMSGSAQCDGCASTAWQTDELGHGTHVAGTIAAWSNTVGVVGVNSDGNIPLHLVKVFSGSGSWIYSSGLIGALNNCVNAGAKIVSMSLGGSFKSRTEERAFAQANDNNGVLSIAASGNGGSRTKSYPASYPSVVSVGAIDSAYNRASFSQYNSEVNSPLCPLPR
jgi:serine protease